jgi:hypothetical protein
MRAGSDSNSIYSKLSNGHFVSTLFGNFLFDEHGIIDAVDPMDPVEMAGQTYSAPVYEGWHTYSFDLLKTPPVDSAAWEDFERVNQLLIAPLEAKTGVEFDIDWVKLTAENRSQDDSFEIVLNINDIDSTSFTVQLAYRIEGQGPGTTPIATVSNVPAGLFRYDWDTSLLNPGDRAIVVATVSDGTSTTAFTARVPIVIGEFVPQPLSFISPLDYNGDGISDQTVYRPIDGTYYQNRSNFGLAAIRWVAGNGYFPVQGDFDGDGATDIALVFEFFGYLGWYITASSTNTVSATIWGLVGDEIAIGDYDGDGRDQIAVFRRGVWFILDEEGGAHTFFWGTEGDLAVPKDYDGDGTDDIAIFRPADGNWFIINSGSASSDVSTITNVQWGLPGDIPVPADWSKTLDGKADFGVYRPQFGLWLTRDIETDEIQLEQWGLPGHVPVLGDFNGDGYPDYSVFEPETAQWYHNLRNRNFGIVQTGLFGDRLPLNIR